MATANSTAAIAVLNDALERLGKARLSLDLARDLLANGGRELHSAGDRIADAATELRALVATVRQ
ncbi:MAG TPA: hypothetical protein VGI90_09805 [Steroidobacteraceae bacterium]|jgi:hypothetical protein